MHARVLMPKGPGFNCSHCQPPIESDAIGVEFDNAASIQILCLPLIRPIGSRRPPDVFVMEPTDAGYFRHRTVGWRLHTPWFGRVLGQR
jgi:hypothetical protein